MSSYAGSTRFPNISAPALESWARRVAREYAESLGTGGTLRDDLNRGISSRFRASAVERATETERLALVLEFVREHGRVSSGDVAAEFGRSPEWARTHLLRLVEMGLIVRRGAKRSTVYEAPLPDHDVRLRRYAEAVMDLAARRGAVTAAFVEQALGVNPVWATSVLDYLERNGRLERNDQDQYIDPQARQVEQTVRRRLERLERGRWVDVRRVLDLLLSEAGAELL